jgi:glycosyltransferase involved in cell wall biosynthesis
MLRPSPRFSRSVSPAESQQTVAEATELVVNIEWPLPTRLPVGTPTAALLSGTCFHRRRHVQTLEIVVDGASHPPAAFGMPRPDVARAAGEAGQLGYRSGFWGVLPIEARPAGEVEARLLARLADGREMTQTIGRIEIAEREQPPGLGAWPERGGGGLIAVCMATFEPDIGLFRTQVDSLRAQTDKRWVCLISDDSSSPERFEEMLEVLDGDSRYVVSRSDERLGFYRNFERALRLVPPEAELVALCDQDDRWHPEKLEVLREAIGGAVLAYSDLRLVDAAGHVLRDTFWKGRRNNHTNLASMLVANTVGGAAMLFRRELAELALPFPETPGFQFHDHWLGVLALAAGDLAYVDRPLYDYVQHRGAVFGEVSQGLAPPTEGRRHRLRSLLQGRRGGFERWRAAYFHGYLPREIQARTLLVRCPEHLTERKRRALSRFVASAQSPGAWAWLAARSARALIGRNETLGSEIQLAQGILWRWMIRLCARAPGGFDASPPPAASFEQKRLRRWRARM